MNEEEKQAIKYWKTHKEILHCNAQIASEHYIKVLLDLVEKQQKEIEELKEKNKILEELLQGRLFELYNYYKELAGKYQGNCISKDKITAVIEQIKISKIANKEIKQAIINLLQSIL